MLLHYKLMPKVGILQGLQSNFYYWALQIGVGVILCGRTFYEEEP
jgi:hypothetical protein